METITNLETKRKVSYDLRSLAWFINENNLADHLEESNDVSEAISAIQTTYATLYIYYLEMIAEG